MDDGDLLPQAANFAPLSPLSFLTRAAITFPDKVAVRDGGKCFTYREFNARCKRLASALRGRGVAYGDVVAIIAPNVPAMLEAHYGVPALGAILAPLNYRLDAASIRFCLEHGEAKVLIADREFAPVVRDVLAQLQRTLLVIEIEGHQGDAAALGSVTYEQLLAEGDPTFTWEGPRDEWDSLCLLYTSGTTGNPKGVVYHHRGAYLNALGNALAFNVSQGSVYLWTLPMFHCSGWTYTWAVTAAGATHVCLRKVDPARIFRTIADYRVTHLCGAPVVLNMLSHAPQEAKVRFDHVVDVATGGAAPSSTVIKAMRKMGFRITHLYGLTESYGPAAVCVWQDQWDDLDLETQARRMARQGVPMPTMEALSVADPATCRPVPQDGMTMGEIMLRGNTIMKGYLKNPQATNSSFVSGWFHTGDLAVWHADGYIEIKDRSKDIIISGGENISSLEVEECLYCHPAVLGAAVVARPDSKWGEVPCAFIELDPTHTAISETELITWCRERLAHFKVPKSVLFGPLPKTSTGKIQKYALRQRLEKPS